MNGGREAVYDLMPVHDKMGTGRIGIILLRGHKLRCLKSSGCPHAAASPRLSDRPKPDATQDREEKPLGQSYAQCP